MAGERSDLGKIFITDGGIYDANTTYEKLTMVSYNNSTYITLRTVTGVTPSNDRINYGLMAQGFTATYLSSVTAEDVQGLVVEAGSETPAQSLINAIADRVANQLVSNSDLQDILSDYILKSAIANNLSITEEGKVLDARQGKALNDALATTNANVAAIPGTITLVKTSDTSPITLHRGTCALIGNKIAIVDAAFDVTGTIASNVFQSMFYFPNREFSRFSDIQCTRIMSGGSTSSNVIIPFAAKNDTHRIGLNGTSTSHMTANTSWWLTGIVFLK